MLNLFCYFCRMKLLIIDDNSAVRTTLRLLLAKEFNEIVAVGDPTLLPALLGAGDVDAVLLDMNFDNQKLDCSAGLFWLERIKGSWNAPAVVVITAFGDVQVAVEAMKLGAEDFVTKPWDNDELREKLERAIVLNRRRRQMRASLEKAKELEETHDARMHMTLDEVKADHIRSIIARCGGNLSAAAEQLGINRQTLYNILKKQ